MRFSVDLSFFSGPLDLLLYLVRKHELDVADIPILMVTEQYLEHLAVLEQIDVNAVGEFLEMASTLIEIKSRLILPSENEVEEEEVEDPRQELVTRLLEYKQYRDAAHMLAERARTWQNRFVRQVVESSPKSMEPADQPLQRVEIWDLVSALGRVLQRGKNESAATSIRYDDTPIHVYMRSIHRQLVEERSMSFAELFPTDVHRSTIVGMFLAVLELIRHRWAKAAQKELFDDIYLEPGEPLPDEIRSVDDYAGKAREATS